MGYVIDMSSCPCCGSGSSSSSSNPLANCDCLDRTPAGPGPFPGAGALDACIGPPEDPDACSGFCEWLWNDPPGEWSLVEDTCEEGGAP